MEFCQLGDLSYFIKKRDTLGKHASTADMIRKYPNPQGGGLNEVVVRHFLKQLSSALEFLRARNFIHRDVKPQNLLLNPSPLFYAKTQPDIIPYTVSENSLIPVAGVESLPMLKIADFGFARSLPSTSLAETLCGSPLYMAPEILRYEKYDAKADLWSVGTVLYEMMAGRPPFRASNHVELLRKIERGDDKIKFPEETTLSDDMKRLIRGLLKRNPVQRMSFADFFNNSVIKDEIPGLVGEDRVSERPISPHEPEKTRPEHQGRRISPDQRAPGTEKDGKSSDLGEITSQSPRDRVVREAQNERIEAHSPASRQTSAPLARPTPAPRRLSQVTQVTHASPAGQGSGQPVRRPHMISHVTAPARQDLHHERPPVGAATAMARQRSRNTPSPGSSLLREQAQERERAPPDKDEKARRDEQERAALEVAFERDYVVVERRAVEVNAFADELAASPRLHGGTPHPQSHGVMVRRATTQATPTSTSGAQVTPARAMQIATGRARPETHHRQASYERRYGPTPSSATSAISKAINMAHGRLFSMGIGFSPPSALGRLGPSPPTYSPFPAYPTSQSSLVVIGDTTKPMPLDEDSRVVNMIEEYATRSDVVYGFAEVKYKQLVPLAPSMDHGLGLCQAGIPEKDPSGLEEEEGLTVDAVVTLSEEALVLYVKALTLLARSMDIAGLWWACKNRGEVIADSASPQSESSSTNSVAVGNRVNSVVQWVRNRFNEVLEKAEFVRLKLIESQKRLPPDHPSHPSKHPSASTSLGGMGTSGDNVVVSSGITAEKLMYDRALEMSRSAAVNELVGEDLPGCEIAYVTAIRMLEAVLESDEEPALKTGTEKGKDKRGSKSEGEAVNGVEADDRKVVVKRTLQSPDQGEVHDDANIPIIVVASIRGRLTSLRNKMSLMAKRIPTTQTQVPPTKAATAISPTPAIAGTPPK